MMTQLTQSATLCGVTRQRRGDRPADRRLSRINLEVYDDERALVAEVKKHAALQNLTFREAVMRALRDWVRAAAADA